MTLVTLTLTLTLTLMDEMVTLITEAKAPWKVASIALLGWSEILVLVVLRVHHLSENTMESSIDGFIKLEQNPGVSSVESASLDRKHHGK